ncbi:MAG: V-type ATP synthase subunit E [Halobacteriota archaeon]
MPMTYEDLIRSMEVNAEKRINEILNKAGQEAEEITRTAKAEAETIKSSYLENAQKSVEIERNQLIYKVKAETKMRVIKEKDAAIQRAFDEAKKSLSDFRDRGTYKEYFKEMIREAVGELQGEKVRFHIDERDENLCKQILAELNENSEIITDLTSAGGLIVSTRDEKVVVFNTIESRLDNARELLKREIFSTLYGD